MLLYLHPFVGIWIYLCLYFPWPSPALAPFPTTLYHDRKLIHPVWHGRMPAPNHCQYNSWHSEQALCHIMPGGQIRCTAPRTAGMPVLLHLSALSAGEEVPLQLCLTPLYTKLCVFVWEGGVNELKRQRERGIKWTNGQCWWMSLSQRQRAGLSFLTSVCFEHVFHLHNEIWETI